MRGFFYATIATLGFLFLTPAPSTQAQVSFGINVGRPAPMCPYGYYGYAPYRCAPYGYYGPEWFSGGAFVGSGPWYHGHDHFYGHVNHSYDPRYGYHGGYPAHGAYQEHPDHFQSFHGSRYSDEGGRYHTERQHGRYAHNDHHDNGNHHDDHR